MNINLIVEVIKLETNNNKLKYESQKSFCERKGAPLFINEDMICPYCKKDIGKELSIVVCMTSHIHGCPLPACHRSYCE